MNRKMSFLLGIVLIAACGGATLGEKGLDETSGNIVNGVPTGTAWGNVGAVMTDFDGDGLDKNDWFCTGSLIAPTVFLTAAHCLEFLPANARIYVTFAPSAEEGVATAIKADAFHFDPAYGHDNSDPHDIGVVILPAGSTSGIAPLKLPPAGYLDDAKVKNGLKDEQFLNVGFGGDVNRTGKPDFKYDGVRKISQSSYKGLEAAWLWLSMQSSTGDGGDCYGDSGGPKFQKSKPDTVLALTVSGDANCRATSKDYRTDSASARAFLQDYVTLP